MRKISKKVFVVYACVIALLISSFLFVIGLNKTYENQHAQISELEPTVPSEVGGNYTFSVNFMTTTYSAVTVTQSVINNTTKTSPTEVQGSAFTYSGNYPSGSVSFTFDTTLYTYNSNNNFASSLSVTVSGNVVTVAFDYGTLAGANGNSVTIYFNALTPSPTNFTITATANNSSYGVVLGGGSYASGATATLTATPLTGYKFVQWNDGNTNATRTVTVTANATYIATFALIDDGGNTGSGDSGTTSNNDFNWTTFAIVTVCIIGGIILLVIIFRKRESK